MRSAGACSEVALHGGELIIYSAHERMEYKNCGLDCMWVNGTRMAESGKLTSIPISGADALLQVMA